MIVYIILILIALHINLKNSYYFLLIPLAAMILYAVYRQRILIMSGVWLEGLGYVSQLLHHNIMLMNFQTYREYIVHEDNKRTCHLPYAVISFFLLQIYWGKR